VIAAYELTTSLPATVFGPSRPVPSPKNSVSARAADGCTTAEASVKKRGHSQAERPWSKLHPFLPIPAAQAPPSSVFSARCGDRRDTETTSTSTVGTTILFILGSRLAHVSETRGELVEVLMQVLEIV
jgi:hypothetical protein